MKTSFLTYLILFGLLLSGCQSSPQSTNSTAIYNLVDITASAEKNKQHLSLNAAQLIPLFNLENDPMSSAVYYQSYITETHLNTVESVKLEASDPINYNKFKRKNKIKHFFSEVNAVLKTLEDADYGRNASSIYIPIANTINRLSKTRANRQILLINSDLFENTFILSKYNSSQMERIRQDPNYLAQVLDKETPIHGRLERMDIYILHQPESGTDEDFYLISHAYKRWLESKGATVIISANLNY